ncbi:uncharacterized protein LOC114814645 [Ornithorhynchus anatinus]|uniref:uncharacterized protein LOC114814645 n=1 Tax=Ornithorhynchus anatinus TaxID=9258 RepID=UPI0010A90355|nr:uncharacterized protein LOC114814645 [Ornithorhynchus anatinus]
MVWRSHGAAGPGPWPDGCRTSSEVGLPPTSPLPFPPPAARSTVSDPLPPALAQDRWARSFDEVVSRRETTTGAAYGPKTSAGRFGQPPALLPPRADRVMGIKGAGDKLALRAWAAALTSRQRKSEMRAGYPGWPNLDPRPTFAPGPLPFGLAAHHTRGPSQTIIPSTENPALAGRIYYIPQRAILHLQDPYLSITAQDFSSADPARRSRLPAETSQAGGSVPPRPPWPDSALLPPRLSGDRVAHLGPLSPSRQWRSLTHASFTPPLHPLRTLDRFCPLEPLWAGLHRRPAPELATVPHFYQPESTRYGSGKPCVL